MKTGYVYILTNRSRRFYIGVTSNLKQRLYQHKAGLIEGFSKAYKLDRLAYFEVFPDMTSAIAREKQLKVWIRAKKIELIAQQNPGWEDLSPLVNAT